MSSIVMACTLAPAITPWWAIGVAIEIALAQLCPGPPGMFDGYRSVTVGTFQETSPMSSEPPPVGPGVWKPSSPALAAGSARGGRISFYLTDNSTFAGGATSLHDNVPASGVGGGGLSALKGATGAKENPHLQALADAEGERDNARRHTEDLRGLLGRLLNEVEDLAPDLRAAIERALAS